MATTKWLRLCLALLISALFIWTIETAENNKCKRSKVIFQNAACKMDVKAGLVNTQNRLACFNECKNSKKCKKAIFVEKWSQDKAKKGTQQNRKVQKVQVYYPSLDRGPLSLPRVRRNIGSDPDNMNRNDSGFLGIIYSSGTTSLQDMARRFTDTMNNIGRFISDANSNGRNTTEYQNNPQRRKRDTYEIENHELPNDNQKPNKMAREKLLKLALLKALTSTQHHHRHSPNDRILDPEPLYAQVLDPKSGSHYKGELKLTYKLLNNHYRNRKQKTEKRRQWPESENLHYRDDRRTERARKRVKKDAGNYLEEQPIVETPGPEENKQHQKSPSGRSFDLSIGEPIVETPGLEENKQHRKPPSGRSFGLSVGQPIDETHDSEEDTQHPKSPRGRLFDFRVESRHRRPSILSYLNPYYDNSYYDNHDYEPYHGHRSSFSVYSPSIFGRSLGNNNQKSHVLRRPLPESSESAELDNLSSVNSKPLYHDEYFIVKKNNGDQTIRIRKPSLIKKEILELNYKLKFNNSHFEHYVEKPVAERERENEEDSLWPPPMPNKNLHLIPYEREVIVPFENQEHRKIDTGEFDHGLPEPSVEANSGEKMQGFEKSEEIDGAKDPDSFEKDNEAPVDPPSNSNENAASDLDTEISKNENELESLEKDENDDLTTRPNRFGQETGNPKSEEAVVPEVDFEEEGNQGEGEAKSSKEDNDDSEDRLKSKEEVQGGSEENQEPSKEPQKEKEVDDSDSSEQAEKKDQKDVGGSNVLPIPENENSSEKGEKTGGGSNVLPISEDTTTDTKTSEKANEEEDYDYKRDVLDKANKSWEDEEDANQESSTKPGEHSAKQEENSNEENSFQPEETNTRKENFDDSQMNSDKADLNPEEENKSEEKVDQNSAEESADKEYRSLKRFRRDSDGERKTFKGKRLVKRSVDLNDMQKYEYEYKNSEQQPECLLSEDDMEPSFSCESSNGPFELEVVEGC